jgi:hypothetical protein
MKCECCGVDCAEAELTEHGGRMLCEDCCMDQLAPPKDCQHGGRTAGAWTRVKAQQEQTEEGNRRRGHPGP